MCNRKCTHTRAPTQIHACTPHTQCHSSPRPGRGCGWVITAEADKVVRQAGCRPALISAIMLPLPQNSWEQQQTDHRCLPLISSVLTHHVHEATVCEISRIFSNNAQHRCLLVECALMWCVSLLFIGVNKTGGLLVRYRNSGCVHFK